MAGRGNSHAAGQLPARVGPRGMLAGQIRGAPPSACKHRRSIFVIGTHGIAATRGITRKRAKPQKAGRLLRWRPNERALLSGCCTLRHAHTPGYARAACEQGGIKMILDDARLFVHALWSDVLSALAAAVRIKKRRPGVSRARGVKLAICHAGRLSTTCTMLETARTPD